MPGIIKIEFAYSLLGEKGNPFKEYHHFDFDLADKKFKFNTRGCNIKANHLNNIELEITNHNFNLDIEGFEDNSIAIRENH